MSERRPHLEVRFLTVLDLGFARVLMCFSPGPETAASCARLSGPRPVGSRAPATVALPLPPRALAAAPPSWTLPPTFSHTSGLLPPSPCAHTQEFARPARHAPRLPLDGRRHR